MFSRMEKNFFERKRLGIADFALDVHFVKLVAWQDNE